MAPRPAHGAALLLVSVLAGCSGPSGPGPPAAAVVHLEVQTIPDDWDCDGLLDQLARLTGHAKGSADPRAFDAALEADLEHLAPVGGVARPAGHWSFPVSTGNFNGGWLYWPVDGHNLTTGQRYRLTAAVTLPNGTELQDVTEFTHGAFALQEQGLCAQGMRPWP